MAGLRKSLLALGNLRHKLEALLASRRSSPGVAGECSQLHELTAFGSNPGNLRMQVLVPERLQRRPALVVALHGCGQSAADYDHGTGWATLADRYGFVVVYPEQQPSNNPKTCFSWFAPGDIARDHGEALSIQQMVEHAITEFGIDRRRVFVTGLSAGGAMASVMLATYPEVYAGGAIIAGLAYGRAGSLQEAFAAMLTEQSPSARALGDRVRAASGHRGPWPRISVWHGSADQIVKPSNAGHIARQWADLHGLAGAPTRSELIAGHTRRVWSDAGGNTVIEAYSIAGMAHGVPIAASTEAEPCGAAGPFFHDVGLSSTHHIARSWGLDDGRSQARSTRARGSVALTTRANGAGEDTAAASLGSKPNRHRLPALDRVIAGAFEAGGLPAADSLRQGPGTPSPLDPGAVIEAALKAAGLRR